MVPGFPDRPKGFKIEDSEAEGSYAKNGNGIAMGEKISRLILDDKDSRFNIAVVREKDIGFFQKVFTHIKIKEGDESIYVNVNSVAKRLHLSKANVKKAAASGQFTSAIKNRSNEVKRILTEYERLFLLHRANAKMDSKLVLKVIGKAESLLRASTPDQKRVQLEIKKKGRTFVAMLDQEGLLNISFIRRKLGEGSFGAVYIVTHLAGNDPAELVIKYAKDNKRAREDVKKEAETLSYLHGDGEVEGIQSKPHRVLSVLTPGSEVKDGYLSVRYAGDLTKAYKEGIIQKIKRGHSLLKAVAIMHKKGVAHKDIKPENILIRGETTVLSDFGDATRFDPSKPIKEWGVHTPVYTHSGLQYKAFSHIERGEAVEVEKCMKQNDVFAIGVVLFQLFTSSNSLFPTLFRHVPFKKVEGYPYVHVDPLGNDPAEEKYSKDMLLKSGVPAPLAELVTKMIFNPTALSADNALAEYTKNLPD